MSIKLCIMSNGDYVIADVYTVKNDSSDVDLGYILKKPRAVLVREDQSDKSSDTSDTKVALFQWPRFSSSESVEILNNGSAITFVDAHEDLYSLYEESLK